MDGNVLPSKLLSGLSNAAGLIRSHDFIQVYSHYDADGLSAASIIANTLKRADKEFRITTFTTLDEENMQIIRECDSDCILITDLGASYIKELEDLGKDVIVLDHHTVRDKSDRICYVNPHLYGVDGGSGACGATMAFLFAITVDSGNWDLVQIAFGGITGDKQHLHGLSGFNTYLLEEGVKKGFITVSEGSLIPPGQIYKSLCEGTEPYIRGVAGNHDATMKLLHDANIPADRSLMVLTDDEKRRLSSMIAIKLTQQGVSLGAMKELARTRYYLNGWNMDAEVLSELLDACGRLLLQGIGISMCLGNKDDLLRANELRNEYNKSILEATLKIDRENGIHEMDNLQWFDSSEYGFTGVVCGIIMRYLGNPDKPTIGVNSSEEKVKLSGRATTEQLEKGIDLANALYLSTKSVGGEGGGHKIASGGSISKGTEEEFLKNLDNIIGEQLKTAM